MRRPSTLVLLSLLTTALALSPMALSAKDDSIEPLDQHGKAQPWKGDPGHLTVIDFAASWCPPCIQSLPRLDKLAASNPQVTVLVVSIDDAKKGRDFLVNELGLKVPVLWDQNYVIAEHYEPEGMPTTIVIDAKGREVSRHVGFSEKQWQELVELVSSQ